VRDDSNVANLGLVDHRLRPKNKFKGGAY
jgi:hypothetical protein